jgi:hypothetical protein
MESVGGIKRSQSVMQIGMGGGMKAGVNIWCALRDVQDSHPAWQHLHGVPITGEEAAGQFRVYTSGCHTQSSTLPDFTWQPNRQPRL